MRRETMHELTQEIVTQFGDEMEMKDVWVEVIDTHPDILPPVQEQVAGLEILDIQKAMKPYVDAFIKAKFQYLPSLPKMYYLTHPVAATMRQAPQPTQGWNKSYVAKPYFDLALAKAVSVAAADFIAGGGNSGTNAVILEYRTPLMQANHKAEAVLDYILSYKMMYEFSSTPSGRFAQLTAQMDVSISEWDKNNQEVSGNPTMGHGHVVEKFEMLARNAGRAKDSKAVAGKRKLYSLKFDAKKDHYYKIHVETYAYCWVANARGAVQVEFQTRSQFNA